MSLMLVELSTQFVYLVLLFSYFQMNKFYESKTIRILIAKQLIDGEGAVYRVEGAISRVERGIYSSVGLPGNFWSKKIFQI